MNTARGPMAQEIPTLQNNSNWLPSFLVGLVIIPPNGHAT